METRPISRLQGGDPNADETRKSGSLGRIYVAVTAVVAWATLALQAFLFINLFLAKGGTFADGVLRFLGFFTILTNILAATVLSLSLVRSFSGSFLTRPNAMSAVAVYITIVGAIYSLVLRALWAPEGLQLLADRVLHDIMPIAYLIFWLLMVRKGTLRWIYPVYWLIYPVLYFVYVLWRGAYSGFYPYPFIDVGVHGYTGVLANAGVMLAAFLTLGLFFVAGDRAMGRPRPTSVARRGS